MKTFNINLQILNDENQDYSHYGSFKQESTPFCIDIKEGLLLGDNIESPEEPLNPEDCTDLTDYKLPNDFYMMGYELMANYDSEVKAAWAIHFGEFTPMPVTDMAWDLLDDKVESDYIMLFDTWWDSYELWDSHGGLEVLKTDMATQWVAYGECRYFVPENCDNNPEYMTRNYGRVTSYHQDWWSYIGFVISINGEQHDSLWGLESDMDDSTKFDVIRHLLPNKINLTDSQLDDLLYGRGIGESNDNNIRWTRPQKHP